MKAEQAREMAHAATAAAENLLDAICKGCEQQPAVQVAVLTLLKLSKDLAKYAYDHSLLVYP